MSKFYIDGSSKGITMGFGIVEVDPFGFMSLHDGFTFHAGSTSNFAELYALEQTLILIKKNARPSDSFEIFLDQLRIVRLFKFTVRNSEVLFTSQLPFEDRDYIARVRALFGSIVTTLGPSGSITVEKIVDRDFAPEEVVYDNTAHKLSRSYFTKVDELFLDDNSPLKEHSNASKITINHSTKKTVYGFEKSYNGRINLDVSRSEDDFWSVKYGDKEVVKSKHLVNIIVHTCDNIAREIEDTDYKVCFFSGFNLYKSIKSSTEYPKCPEDIKSKGLRILDMVSSNEVLLVKK